MSPESSGWMGLEDASRPDDDWPEDDADDDWPDDDDADEQPGVPWPPGPPGPAPGWAGGPPWWSRVRPLAIAAVAVVALGVGAGVAVAVGRGLSSSPAATQTPGNSQPTNVPGGNGGGVPPGAVPGSGGVVGQLILGGKVTAVSSTSITISGNGHAVTAAVTNSTKVTGKVTSIGAVKVGDLVVAQITESGGRAVATAIQDPASLPPSGGMAPIGGSGP
jgi:hypothetical protein